MINDDLIRERAAEIARDLHPGMTVQPYAHVQSALDGGAFVDVTLRLSAADIGERQESIE